MILVVILSLGMSLFGLEISRRVANVLKDRILTDSSCGNFVNFHRQSVYLKNAH